MLELNVSLAIIAAVVIGTGLLSNAIKKSLVQEPMIAVAAGFLCGPFVLGLIEPSQWGDERVILEEGARLTLAVALMSVALRLDRAILLALWQPAALMLTIGMIGMWLVMAGVAGTLLGLGLWSALLLGAALAPTDPVAASAIVTGPFAKSHLPSRVRSLLSLESGANDGLAYALVFLPLFFLKETQSAPLATWFWESIVIGILGAVAVGVVVGYGAAKALVLAEKTKVMGNYSHLSYTIALSFFTLGIAALLGTDALISVFIAGLVLSVNVDKSEQHQEENVQEAVAKLFTLPLFVVFGAALPLEAWMELGLPLAGLCVLVLLVRRPPVILAIAPLVKQWETGRDMAYLAWFGPLGAAAIYYCCLAWGETGDPVFWHAGSAAIMASILAHGGSAAALTRLYARKQENTPPRTRVIEQED